MLSQSKGHFQILLIPKPFLNSDLQNQSRHQYKTKHIQRPNSKILLLLKMPMTWTCWCCQPFHLIYQYQKKSIKKKEWTEAIKKIKGMLHEHIMVNTNAMRQQEACTVYQISSCSERAMQKKAYLNEKHCRISDKMTTDKAGRSKRTRWKNNRRWDRDIK